MIITIATNDRAFIAGQTGSGKTYLAQRLLRDIPRLVVFDIKGNLKDRFKLKEDKHKAGRLLERGYDARIRVKVPILPPSEYYSFYEEQFQRFYEIGNLMIYIDELYGVVQNPNRIPTYLNAIYTRGREISKTGIIAAVQRPKFIPNFVISESTHFFVFRLSVQDDRKKLADTIGESVLTLPPDKYGFYYYNYDMKHPVYVPKL